MGRAITFLFMSVMCLAMPELLHTLTNGMMTPEAQSTGDFGKIVLDTQESFKSMGNLIGALSYMVGIVFALKGVLAFKEFTEYGEYSNSQEYESKTNIVKDSDKSESEPISLEKENLNSFVKLEEKVDFKFNLDFENKQLNDKLINIEKLINTIISLPVLEQDVENKVLLSSTQETYIKQIHLAYVSIPKELRDRDVKGSTATKLALEQLILVENGLLEMETELLNQQVSDLNIMSRFLKEKFPEQEKQYIKLAK